MSASEMPERPLFLEQTSYRRRRLGDAARVLPVAAAVGVLVPVAWLPSVFATAWGVTVLFILWAGLILIVGLLHRALSKAESAMLEARNAASPGEGDDAV